MTALATRSALFAPFVAAALLAGGVCDARGDEARAAPARAALPMPVPAMPAPDGPTREKLLKLGYRVYVGGLNIFDFTIDFALGAESYSIKGDGESRGIARMFWRWATHISAGGNVGAEGVRPQIYNVDTFRPKRDRSMQLSFDEHGKYTIRRTPPDTAHRAAKRDLPVIVPPKTLDPLSIALMIGRDIARGRGCKGMHPIFDGNRRYNLTFTDLGPGAVPKTPYSVYTGNAYRCQFDIQRISGFQNPREFLRFWDEDNYDPPMIWLARLVPGLPPVPVRLEGDLNMGGLRAYLVWAEYAGQSLFPNSEKPDLRVARRP